MTELIKQRLVGMLILVIAGVVFIPDLLDGQKNSVKQDFKKIPPRPESSESPVIRDFPLAQVQEAIKQTPKPSYEIADENAAPVNSNSQVAKAKVEESFSEETGIESTEQAKEVVAEPQAQKPSQFERSAWVLRLGTFRNKPNVDALLTKLENAGVTTFVKPVEAKAGTLYRVFVGPELEKAKLEKAQKTLKELTGLNGKITEFEPIN